MKDPPEMRHTFMPIPECCPRFNKSAKIGPKTMCHMHHSKTKATFNANNLVYCISWSTCGRQVMGLTKNSVKKIFQSRFYPIVGLFHTILRFYSQI